LRKWHKAPLTFTQVFGTETIDFTEQEDGERRHKNSEAVHYSKHNQLILYRHDAQVREKEQNQKRQEWNGKTA